MNAPKSFLILIPVFCLVSLQGLTKLAAQQFYQPLDTLDQTLFISGISSNILSQNKIEVFAYSLLNSYWLALHEYGLDSPVRDRFRATISLTNVEAYYGFSKSKRWDLGLRLQYTRSRLDNEAASSVFRVFQSKTAEEANINLDKTYSGLTGIGLRFRVMPVVKMPGLLITGGYSRPSVKLEEDQHNLQAERDILDLGVTYYKDLNPNVYYYFIATGQTYLPSSLNDEYLFNAGGSFFLVHMFYNRLLMVYPGLSYNIGFKPPAFGNEFLIKTQDQVLALLGVQYQPNYSLSFNASLAYPLLSNSTAPYVKLVRKSYSFFSLGFRIVI